MRCVAIAVAPNGARRSQVNHPALPTTPADLARAASACLEAGAAMIHVHVRDRDSRHLLDAEAYADALAAIHGAVGDRLLVQITSESGGRYGPAEQIAVVGATRCEAVSLALRELAPDESHEPAFFELLGELRRREVVPQIILYDPSEVDRLKRAQQSGALPFADLPVLFVLGRYVSGQLAEPAEFLPFALAASGAFHDQMLCAFGRRELQCVTLGALLGSDVRVGFENNLQLPNGEVAGSNADLVRSAKAAIEACGLATARADALRERWSALVA
jgi:uncharacterized protein (DUF849 family)